MFGAYKQASHRILSTQDLELLSKLLIKPGVALTQISAYITYKSLSVCKIMNAMRTAYAKGGTRSEHVSSLVEANDHGLGLGLGHASTHPCPQALFPTPPPRRGKEPGDEDGESVKGQRASFANNSLFGWKLFDEPGGKGTLELRHLFLYFFSLVRISEFWFAYFSSTCVRCTHLLKS